MKAFLQILIMLAIITAGISPACAFIGGGDKGWIEICASDGTVKTILVSSGFLPEGGDQQQSHDSAFDECSFCFATSHGKSLKAAASVAVSSIAGQYLAVGHSTFIPVSLKLNAFSARAPPVIF